MLAWQELQSSDRIASIALFFFKRWPNRLGKCTSWHLNLDQVAGLPTFTAAYGAFMGLPRSDIKNHQNKQKTKAR